MHSHSCGGTCHFLIPREAPSNLNVLHSWGPGLQSLSSPLGGPCINMEDNRIDYVVSPPPSPHRCYNTEHITCLICIFFRRKACLGIRYLAAREIPKATPRLVAPGSRHWEHVT
ncbi:hypothetical protein BD779DRAFT_168813 [Infundibulicybe gibba]|nr:hypothetical protein BD779DRAFT_168813 [Infundibulicybe gibba]